MRYAVKCSECRRDVRRTDDVRESYAGCTCYECKIIAEAQIVGIEVDPDHVLGNTEVIWQLRHDARVIAAMDEPYRSEAVARVNEGWPLRFSEAWSQ